MSIIVSLSVRTQGGTTPGASSRSSSTTFTRENEDAAYAPKQKRQQSSLRAKVGVDLDSDDTCSEQLEQVQAREGYVCPVTDYLDQSLAGTNSEMYETLLLSSSIQQSDRMDVAHILPFALAAVENESTDTLTVG